MMGSWVDVTVVKKSRTWMEDGPDVVYHLSMRLHHVEIEPIRILTFEVSEETLTKSGHLHYAADALSSEESVKFGDGSIEGLGGGSALEFKVHLLGASTTAVVGGGGNESGELFGVEGCVLHR
jgi:hypothetical protein